MLTTNPELTIIGEACSGGEAVVQAEQCCPDVILMDVRMPGMDGLAATREIKQKWPQIRIVLLSMYDTYRQEASQAGAEAFLVKGCSLEELLRALMPPHTKAL